MTHTNRTLAELNYSFPRSYTARRVLFSISPLPFWQGRSSCGSERGAVTAAGPGPACPVLPTPGAPGPVAPPPDPARAEGTEPPLWPGPRPPGCCSVAPIQRLDPGAPGGTGQHRRQGPRPQRLTGAPAVLPPAAQPRTVRSSPRTNPALTAATSATLFVHVGTAGRALRGGRGSGRPGARSTRSAPRGRSCSFSSFSFSSSFFSLLLRCCCYCCYYRRRAPPPRPCPPNPASVPAAATALAQPPAPLM